ncbi:MAG: XRE family transcriptional regulator [Syntrophomonadaceae bacterium]|nr:XRE family transcriptional regulator [Syntrophomonadaceae bacterium]MDD3270869.1 XRE family transcriptional regulator [Syntrophomonadaceae bacterium]MDD3898549.1 XRE family transcriptional regulator [Syntrophomonadaceae bacterium]MDD4562976.1 XRE family transcriptional regulator [Syntrophomonadaceae bacterium]
MPFAERLQYLRLEMNLSEKQLADAIDITETAIRLYEQGKLEVTLEVLEKLADYFDVSTKLLLGTIFSTLPADEAVNGYRIVQEMVETRNKEKSHRQTNAAVQEIQLPPVDSWVQATGSLPSVSGGQVPVFDRIKRTLAMNDDYIVEYRSINNSITKIFGDDLANYFYLYVYGDNMNPTLKDQDTVLVKKHSPVENNDIVVALTGFEDAVIARITRTENQIILFFDNSNYPAEIYTEGQYRIVGKVIWKSPT